MPSLAPHPPTKWALVLWWWTTQWRLPSRLQRQMLAWWQSVGWEAGWERLRAGESHLAEVQLPLWPQSSHTVNDPAAWKKLEYALHSGEVQKLSTGTFPWVSCACPCFPTPLQRDDQAPTLLWSNRPWEFEPSLFQRPVLAVVGSRRCSQYGALAVRTLIPEFARRHDALIVSGGAPGIDLAAHQAAVQVGQPTWVVLGSGLKHFPARLTSFNTSPNRVISPFPPEQPPQKWTFPARNHVIAQLAQGVLVVEAAANSGSLITAGAALEYGKELMVVLPPFSSPNAPGSMRLLQQGAVPVATAADIAGALGLHSKTQSPTQERTYPKTENEQEVIEILQKNGGSSPLGKLISGLSFSTQKQHLPASVLTTLELRGIIQIELGVVRLQSVLQS